MQLDRDRRYNLGHGTLGGSNSSYPIERSGEMHETLNRHARRDGRLSSRRTADRSVEVNIKVVHVSGFWPLSPRVSPLFEPWQVPDKFDCVPDVPSYMSGCCQTPINRYRSGNTGKKGDVFGAKCDDGNGWITNAKSRERSPYRINFILKKNNDKRITITFRHRPIFDSNLSSDLTSVSI